MAATLRWLGLLLGLALAACASQAPTFDQAEPTLLRPPGTARIIVYRDFEPYQSLSWDPVLFNGAAVGAVGPGHVIVRDVPPGTYSLEAKSDGLWPNQVKTVTVAPGQTVYAKITSFKGLNPAISNTDAVLTTFVLDLIDPVIARREVGQLWYTATAHRRAVLV